MLGLVCMHAGHDLCRLSLRSAASCALLLQRQGVKVCMENTESRPNVHVPLTNFSEAVATVADSMCTDHRSQTW